MSILLDEDSRVLVQGITGREGTFHSDLMLEYGTNLVGGVTPGREGEEVNGLPVFNSVRKAVEETGADTTVIYVPPPFAADAIQEAAEAGIELIVCITEGIPLRDMIQVRAVLEDSTSRLIGPNCPGIISPGRAKVGIMPGRIHSRGTVGVMSRSGTLTYEIVNELTQAGYGQSTCIGVGGDPIIGSPFRALMPLYEKDPDTDALVLIGEIGGTAEQEAARYYSQAMGIPAIGFIAGRSAPEGKTMGHAGAIISGEEGKPGAKIEAFEEVGIRVADFPSDIPRLLDDLLPDR